MSAPRPITVVARWHAGGGSVETILGLIAELRPRALAEPGCLGYDVFRHIDSPGELLLVERYRDETALEAHRASEHYQDFVVHRIVPLLASREVDILVPRGDA